jgi:hypothetical protein
LEIIKDSDPGIAAFSIKFEKNAPAGIQGFVHHENGLFPTAYEKRAVFLSNRRFASETL